MNMEAIKNRDYTLIVDKSGSMSTADVNGKSRWKVAEETTLAFANKMAELDPDGITIYAFSSNFKRYEGVNSGSKVSDIWRENEPNGGTALAEVLEHAFADYFGRKSKGQTKSGDTILVITDGEPNDREAVKRTIINATKKMDVDEELAVSFIQIGNDSGASAFLTELDDNLTGKGAKFDIVDAMKSGDTENMTLSEVLMKAITD